MEHLLEVEVFTYIKHVLYNKPWSQTTYFVAECFSIRLTGFLFITNEHIVTIFSTYLLRFL